MACWLLQPVGAATAAALWPRFLLPAPRRSSATRPHRGPCLNQFSWKLPLSAAQSDRSRSLVGCSSSSSSAELSRPADVSTAYSDPSVRRRTDSVPGALIVIFGYWTGPDVDDGCGKVEAMLQRIV